MNIFGFKYILSLILYLRLIYSFVIPFKLVLRRVKYEYTGCQYRMSSSIGESNINTANHNNNSSYFERMLNSISFGYERINNYSEIEMSTAVIPSYALCFPSHSRPRGCEPLLSTKRSKNSDIIPVAPCVDGICPYIKFRCSKGHEWKAIPNTPVCLHCPICKYPKKIVGISNDDIIKSNQKDYNIITSVNDVVRRNGGRLLTRRLDSKDKWKSKIQIECKNGHHWSSTPTNIVINKSWCRKCQLPKSNTIYEETAQYFNGKFLGMLENSNDPILSSEIHINQVTLLSKPSRKNVPIPFWRCEYGHEFALELTNIRRRNGGKRKCSWCPKCRKEGMMFEWRL